MLVLRADVDALQEAKTVLEIFEVFGIGEGEKIKFTDEKVFGERANYANTFCTDLTFKMVHDILNKNEKHMMRNRSGAEWSPEAVNWCWYSPISTGPRYEDFVKLLGDEPQDNRIYILTPDDKMYEEAPKV